jgi:hypothetical protein
LIFLRDIKSGIYSQTGEQSIPFELLQPDRQGLPLQMGFSRAQAKVKPGPTNYEKRLDREKDLRFTILNSGFLVFNFVF